MKVFLMTLATLCLFMVVSCIKVESPPKYEGPQTTEALLETFGEKVGTNPEIDEKYPQAEWLQMLLEKGITIEHFGDYSVYMSVRWSLARLENQPEKWVSGKLGIPPTDDWELYKNAYVDRRIWERQQLKAARQTDPQVLNVLFLGPNRDTVIPVHGKKCYCAPNSRWRGFLPVAAFLMNKNLTFYFVGNIREVGKLSTLMRLIIFSMRNRLLLALKNWGFQRMSRGPRKTKNTWIASIMK